MGSLRFYLLYSRLLREIRTNSKSGVALPTPYASQQYRMERLLEDAEDRNVIGLTYKTCKALLHKDYFSKNER